MKKFTKLLSIVSSILGVLTITLGVSLGVFEKPRTISSVSAVDLPTDLYLDNVYSTSQNINYFNTNSAGTFTLGFNAFLSFNSYVYVNATSGFDVYIGGLEFDNVSLSILRNIDNVYLTSSALAGFIIAEDEFFYVGNFKDNDLNRIAGFGFNFSFDFTFAANGNFYFYLKVNNSDRFSFVSDDFLWLILNGAITRPAQEYHYDYSFSINSVNSRSVNAGYDIGYQNGYNYAVNSISSNPSEIGLYTYEEYTNYGIEKYNEGVSYASENDLNFYNFLTTLFKAPTDIFKGVWNWSLPLGNGTSLNLLPLMTFLLTIAIALAVIKLILGGK